MSASVYSRDKFWQRAPSVIHRKVRVTTAGSAGSAVGTAFVPVPPGRIRAVKVDFHASAAATQDTVIKTDVTDRSGTGGTTILTLTDTNTDIPVRALGVPAAIDEGNAAVAATDATDGGAFVKSNIYIDVAQGDALTDAVIVEFWIDRLRYEELTLVSQSGADGAGVVTRTLDLNGAGVLLGVSVDYQNMPVTTDIVVKADGSSGDTALTIASAATDIVKKPLGLIGIDEANAAIAATDGSAGGFPFRRNLYFDVAEADAFTSGNEKIVIGLFIKQ